MAVADLPLWNAVSSYYKYEQSAEPGTHKALTSQVVSNLDLYFQIISLLERRDTTWQWLIP